MPTGIEFMEKQSKIGEYIPGTKKLLSTHGAINNSLHIITVAPSLINPFTAQESSFVKSFYMYDEILTALFKAWTLFNFRHKCTYRMVMRLAMLIIAKVFLYV